MSFSVTGLLVMLLLAAICGGIGRAIAGDIRGGLLVSIAVGFIGAVIGPWIALQLKLSEPFVLHVAGQSFPIVWSIVGAAIFVALIHLVAQRR